MLSAVSLVQLIDVVVALPRAELRYLNVVALTGGTRLYYQRRTSHNPQNVSLGWHPGTTSRAPYPVTSVGR